MRDFEDRVASTYCPVCNTRYTAKEESFGLIKIIDKCIECLHDVQEKEAAMPGRREAVIRKRAQADLLVQKVGKVSTLPAEPGKWLIASVLLGYDDDGAYWTVTMLRLRDDEKVG